MDKEKLQQLNKLQLFSKNPQLAIHQELVSLCLTLKEVKGLLEISVGRPDIKFPDIPPMPEIPKMDMKETNALLEKLLATQKDKKQEDIELTLDIE